PVGQDGCITMADRFDTVERMSITSVERTRVTAKIDHVPDRGVALIVFSRLWYPGYEVRLNGERLPLLLVEGILPAVKLPGGAQGELELVYRPVSQRVGLLISVITLLLTGLMVCRHRAGR
ncbi:MAG: hypothetical protein V3R81_10475, partial [Gammaproteobacteria bacterium]